LSLVEETCDITLKEIQAQLTERGHRFSIGSLWVFSIATTSRLKKVRARERAGPPGRP